MGTASAGGGAGGGQGGGGARLGAPVGILGLSAAGEGPRPNRPPGGAFLRKRSPSPATPGTPGEFWVTPWAPLRVSPFGPPLSSRTEPASVRPSKPSPGTPASTSA